MVLVVISIMLMFFLLIALRRNLIKAAMELDEKAVTPSDFALIGKNLEFDNDKYDPDSIHEHLKGYFANEKFFKLTK